ncbi:STM3941 family protein [Kordia sp.]|uniref:STM3941 family protein n=1 Tax=Kordia sp. TaxID=1965332 RepID=UPI003B5A812E
MSDQIEIATSKRKMFLYTLGSIAFVVSGFFIYKNESNLKFIGMIAMLFFGLTGILALKRLIQSKAGLIINSKGIIDNSTATSVGFIPWQDINGFQPIKVVSNDFLVVHVKNPKAYINKEKNILTRQSLQYNLNNYGSPIAINSASLVSKFETTEQILLKASKKYSTTSGQARETLNRNN